MRKNTREVFNAWKDGKRLKKCDSIWTNGEVIYSYNTWLLAPYPKRIGKYLFNLTEYSRTTTNHQHSIEWLLRALQGAAYNYSVWTFHHEAIGSNPPTKIRARPQPLTPKEDQPG